MSTGTVTGLLAGLFFVVVGAYWRYRPASLRPLGSATEWQQRPEEAAARHRRHARRLGAFLIVLGVVFLLGVLGRLL
ncbi:hypothetical protein [Halorarius halobius]|uniref:hypothetical protein n=1 Tax=Halorarius halobius TaxID=2962671 RepID=UPI0020CEBC79|nr:hypothetical protein [Halorarius halobius]